MTPHERNQFATLWKFLQQEAHTTMVANGFWDERKTLLEVVAANAPNLSTFALKAVQGQCIALMHSELSEGLEGIRKDLKDDKCPQFDMETVELADTVLRILDYAEGYNLPVIDALFAKMEVNRARGYKHGGKAF